MSPLDPSPFLSAQGGKNKRIFSCLFSCIRISALRTKWNLTGADVFILTSQSSSIQFL